MPVKGLGKNPDETFKPESGLTRLLLRQKTSTMRWSVILLIMVIYALWSCKAQDSTSSARCRFPPNIRVGQHIRIQFLLSRDPKIDKKSVHISKVTDGTRICVPRNEREFIVETKFNVMTGNMDNYTCEGYIYGGIDKELFLTTFIKKVGPQHEGIYVVEEYSKDLTYVCYLKVLDDAHREDCKAWKEAFKGLLAFLITLVIVVGLVVLGAYWIKQKRTAASKQKTGREEANDNARSGQDETTDDWNASGMPSGDNSLLLREDSKQRPGFASGMQPDPGNDNHDIDMGNYDAASTSMLPGKQDAKKRLQGSGKASTQVETQDADFSVRSN